MEKILFIEDEFVLQKTIGEFLRKKGYRIIHALNGEEGLNLATEEKPDLILLDLILPRLNGFEVLRRLKEDAKTQNIPVIILTNLENPSDIEKSIELGATTYLVKSDQNLDDIAEKVGKAIK